MVYWTRDCLPRVALLTWSQPNPPAWVFLSFCGRTKLTKFYSIRALWFKHSTKIGLICACFSGTRHRLDLFTYSLATDRIYRGMSTQASAHWDRCHWVSYLLFNIFPINPGVSCALGVTQCILWGLTIHHSWRKKVPLSFLVMIDGSWVFGMVLGILMTTCFLFGYHFTNMFFCSGNRWMYSQCICPETGPSVQPIFVRA